MLIGIILLGVRVPGEQLSYVFTGTIPPFEPIFTLNVTVSISLKLFLLQRKGGKGFFITT